MLIWVEGMTSGLETAVTLITGARKGCTVPGIAAELAGMAQSLIPSPIPKLIEID